MIKNKKILFINIVIIFILILGCFTIIIKTEDKKYINFEKLKEDFDSLKTTLARKGYEIEINNSENLIAIKRDNMKIYFNSN